MFLIWTDVIALPALASPPAAGQATSEPLDFGWFTQSIPPWAMADPRMKEAARECDALRRAGLEHDTPAIRFHVERLHTILADVLGADHPVAKDIRFIVLMMREVDAEVFDFENAMNKSAEEFGDRPVDWSPVFNQFAVVDRDLANNSGTYLANLMRLRDEKTLALGEIHPDVIRLWLKIADVHFRAGQYAPAMTCARRIDLLCEAEPEGLRAEKAAALEMMGAVHDATGDFPRALERLEQALVVRRQFLGNDHRTVGEAYARIARVHWSRGDRTACIRHLAVAIDILVRASGGDHPFMAPVYNDYGSCLTAQGFTDSARAFHGVVLAIRGLRGDSAHPDVAAALVGMGDAFRKSRASADALDRYVRALPIYLSVRGARHPDVARTYLGIAWSYLGLENLSAARKNLQRAVEALSLSAAPWDGTARTLRPMPVTVEYLHTLSIVQSYETSIPQPERDEAALRTAVVALDVLSQLRLNVSRAARETHEERFEALPGWILQLLLRLRQAGRPVDHALALRAAETISSVSFLEMWAAARADVAGGLPADLASEEEDLLARIHRADLNAGDSTADLERMSLEEKFRSLVTRLHHRAPRVAALRYPRPASLSAARGALNPDEAALTFVPWGAGGFLVAVTKESVSLVSLCETGLSDRIAALRAAMTGSDGSPSSRGVTVASASDPTFAEPGEAYRFFFGAVADLVRGKRLIIVPNGPFELLSFEALPMAGGRWLAEKHAVQYVPSLAILALIRSRGEEEFPAKDRLLAVGNPEYDGASDREAQLTRSRYSAAVREGWIPLPGTEVEVRAIAEMFPKKRISLLLGKRATEEKVLARDWGDYSYLHFACHGVVEEGPGRQPALVLSQVGNRPPSDGFLTLAEVIARPHRAKLAVLSACNTGRRGPGYARTGVSSLARAFLLAGSRAVIVSLWPVSDEATARLMRELYRGMREKSLSPADALRRAQAELRSAPAMSMPEHWAPFILVGS